MLRESRSVDLGALLLKDDQLYTRTSTEGLTENPIVECLATCCSTRFVAARMQAWKPVKAAPTTLSNLLRFSCPDTLGLLSSSPHRVGGYQKWFEYEAPGLIPYITHGPLIFGCTLLSAFVVQPISWGFRNGCSERSCSPDSGKKLGIFGAVGSCAPLLRPPLSFLSFRMGGLPLPAGSQQ